MDFTTLRDRIEQDANSILGPDLRANSASSAYVVLATETGFCFDAVDFHGLYHSDLHKILETDIGSRWVGPGPAVLVADQFVEDEERFVGIVIHELGHAVDYHHGMYRHDVIDGVRVQHVRRSTFENSVESPAEFEKYSAPRSVRVGHEWSWIRATLHLHYRFTALGWDCPLPNLYPHEHYAISNPAAFRRALDGEPERLASVPLTQLKAISPPTGFVDLYDDCCRRWPDV